MQYSVFGRDDPAAPTVLLSAGLGGLAGFWKPQVEALSARYRLLAFDHRGTGANAGPLPQGYSIQDMADEALAVMDAAGIARCHMLGHALGGLVGLQMALQAPERLASIVPVNAWARLDSATARCFDARVALLQHVGAEAYVRAQPIFLYPSAWMSQHAERLEAEVQHGLAHFQGKDTLLTRLSALRAFDVAHRLAEVKVPVLAMAARDDVLVPHIRSAELVEGLPHARLWLTAEGGHACSVTDPEPFNRALLDFLTEIDHG